MTDPTTTQIPPTDDAALRTSEDDYWTSARRPLACLIFLIPLLGLYEWGVVWLGGDQAESFRNGADYWMRAGLQEIGLMHSHLLPAIVIGLLLVWHISGRYSWRVSRETLLGMSAESLLFALVLVVIGQLQNLAFMKYEQSYTAVSTSLGSGSLTKIVSFVGAGVYEEVLFRLWMLPACYALFFLLFRSPRWAAGTAIAVTSILFSLAHYIGPNGEAFSLITFSFRALAGTFFAILFLLRGFGITVGCHAAYDLLVGLMLTGDSVAL